MKMYHFVGLVLAVISMIAGFYNGRKEALTLQPELSFRAPKEKSGKQKSDNVELNWSNQYAHTMDEKRKYNLRKTIR